MVEENTKPSTESRLLRKKKRRRTIFLIYGVFLLALLEGASLFVGKVLQSKWGMYEDPVGPIQTEGTTYEEYLQIRNPILGWPRARELGTAYDQDGSHWCRGSGADDAQRWSLSLYGDSFTADDQGGDRDRWGCRIQRLTGTKVRNFGVGGYGTDQALIRYLENKMDRAELVVLSHMTRGIIRNITRYRGFRPGSSWDLSFKPRFVLLESGDLKRIPILTLTASEVRRFLSLETPQLVLPYEYFHPNGPSGAVQLKFPYTIALIRNMNYWGLKVRIKGGPLHTSFYALNHPAGGLQITTAIMLEFVRVAQVRGQKSLLIIFPTYADLELFRKTDQWVYQTLLDALLKAGVTPLNFGESLIENFKGRPLAEVFGAGSNQEINHYNAEASHLVAGTVIQHLNKTGLLSISLKK